MGSYVAPGQSLGSIIGTGTFEAVIPLSENEAALIPRCGSRGEIASKRRYTRFMAGLIAIYALLAIPIRSYIQPLIIMAVIPFAIIGALISHLVLGLPLGVLSMFGIIALSGVIVNGSLILIDFINENLSNGMLIEDAILDGAKSRFHPIMLTSLTTFLGVAPITFETSLQAQFLIPMSASLGFGLLFGAIILQLLIAALVLLEYRRKRRIKRMWSGVEREPLNI